MDRFVNWMERHPWLATLLLISYIAFAPPLVAWMLGLKGP